MIYVFFFFLLYVDFRVVWDPHTMICGKYICVCYIFFHHSRESLFWVTNLKIRLGFMVKLMGKEKLSVTMWKRLNMICSIYGTIWNHRCRRFSVWFKYNNITWHQIVMSRATLITLHLMVTSVTFRFFGTRSSSTHIT